MKTAEKILKEIQTLPHQMQEEVLDFVGYLKKRKGKKLIRVEELDWSAFSLKNSLADMEDEPTSDYGEADLKEKWK